MGKNTPFGTDDVEASTDPSTTTPGQGDVTPPVDPAPNPAPEAPQPGADAEGFGGDAPEPATEESTEYVAPEGGVVVKTKIGHAFVDPDSGLPAVTTDGLTVTQEQADSLIAKGEGLVYLATPKEG